MIRIGMGVMLIRCKGCSDACKKKKPLGLVAVIQNLDSTDFYLGWFQVFFGLSDWFFHRIGPGFFIGLDLWFFVGQVIGFFIGLDILKV